jgi:polar amino acid transport system substrate-binding protein
MKGQDHKILPILGSMIFALGGVQAVAPPSAFGADLETIRQRGYLLVAVKDNLRPLGFRDASGSLQGFEVDIARRLAKDLLGSEDAVQYRAVQNPDRLSVLLNGEVDVTIAHVTATASRARQVYFTMPYYFEGKALISQRVIKTPKDLMGQTVALLKGSVNTEGLLKKEIPRVRLQWVDSYGEGKRAIESGAAQAFAGDTIPLVGWQQEDFTYSLTSMQTMREPIAIAFPKGLEYESLGKALRQSLDHWRQENWLEAQAIRWGLP